MTSKYFLLLIKALELENLLEKENFSSIILREIEKDNKNKKWTFNFEAEFLPSADDLFLFIKKLKRRFLSDFELDYNFNITSCKNETILEYFSFVISNVLSNEKAVEFIINNEIKIENKEIIVEVSTPTIWEKYIENNKKFIINEYYKLGINIDNIKPSFNIKKIISKKEEYIDNTIKKAEEKLSEKKEEKTSKTFENNINFQPKKILDLSLIHISEPTRPY